MKKYVKSVLLILSIILILITIVMFLKFLIEKQYGFIEEYNVNLLYDKKWHKVGVSYYENNELIMENFELNDSRFIVFDDSYVEFCDEYGIDCKKYDYEYNKEDSVIFFDSESYLIEKGTYYVKFGKDTFELSVQYDNGGKVIYHFEIVEERMK